MKVWREVYEQDCYRVSELPDFGPDGCLVDIGAHTGAFAMLWHERYPRHRIRCVEACPENIPVLTANVERFAQVRIGACTYEPGELMLLNSILPDGCGSATGGSRVAVLGGPNLETFGHRAWLDTRPLRQFTLEDVSDGHPITVLKIDAEGAEWSILRHTTSLDRIRWIVGEFHCRESIHEWVHFLATHSILKDWEYRQLSLHPNKPLGLFHLKNPAP